MPIIVAAVMPNTTVVPSTWRDVAPAPVAVASGSAPKMNANDVMRIGRRRSRAPSIAASTSGMPRWCERRANSTMRIAFLAASPISMTRPTCA